MKFIRLTVLLLVVFLSYTCKQNTDVTPTTTTTSPGTTNPSTLPGSTQGNGASSATTLKPVAGNDLNPQKILDLVNYQRKTGCKCASFTMPAVAVLKWNAVLEKAAYLHSLDMKTQNYFSHIGKDGKYPWDRILAQGYKYSVSGENIGAGYSDENAAVAGWLDTESHCKNLMSPDYTEMGIGRSLTIWTAEFAKPQ